MLTRRRERSPRGPLPERMAVLQVLRARTGAVGPADQPERRGPIPVADPQVAEAADVHDGGPPSTRLRALGAQLGKGGGMHDREAARTTAPLGALGCSGAAGNDPRARDGAPSGGGPRPAGRIHAAPTPGGVDTGVGLLPRGRWSGRRDSPEYRARAWKRQPALPRVSAGEGGRGRAILPIPPPCGRSGGDPGHGHPPERRSPPPAAERPHPRRRCTPRGAVQRRAGSGGGSPARRRRSARATVRP